MTATPCLLGLLVCRRGDCWSSQLLSGRPCPHNRWLRPGAFQAPGESLSTAFSLQWTLSFSWRASQAEPWPAPVPHWGGRSPGLTCEPPSWGVLPPRRSHPSPTLQAAGGLPGAEAERGRREREREADSRAQKERSVNARRSAERERSWSGRRSVNWSAEGSSAREKELKAAKALEPPFLPVAELRAAEPRCRGAAKPRSSLPQPAGLGRGARAVPCRW